MIQNETKFVMFLFARKTAALIALALVVYILGYFSGLARYQPDIIKVILNGPSLILQRS